MDQKRQVGQQRPRNAAGRRYQKAAQRADQEVGALGGNRQNLQNQQQQQRQNEQQNAFTDFNTDFEIGELTADLNANADLNDQYEIGELGRQGRQQNQRAGGLKQQRTQRKQ